MHPVIRVVLFSVVLLPTGFLHADVTSYTWNHATSDQWSTATNWTPTTGFPNGGDQQAIFGSTPTTSLTVTVSIPITVGSIQFDNVNNYTISLDDSLTFLATGGPATMIVSSATGHPIISGDPITLASDLSITQSSTGGLSIESVIAESDRKSVV